MQTAQFKVGDKVMSAMNGTDRGLIRDVYRGVITQVRGGVGGAPDGHCYIVDGRWDKYDPNGKITFRQLWSDNIEINNGN